jgi:hypothetical protein
LEIRGWYNKPLASAKLVAVLPGGKSAELGPNPKLYYISSINLITQNILRKSANSVTGIVTGVWRSVFTVYVYQVRQRASTPQTDKAGFFILLYAVVISSFTQTSFNDQYLNLQPDISTMQQAP